MATHAAPRQSKVKAGGRGTKHNALILLKGDHEEVAELRDTTRDPQQGGKETSFPP
jgi:hypothetical protein